MKFRNEKAKQPTSFGKRDDFRSLAEKIILNTRIDGGSFDVLRSGGSRSCCGCGAGVTVERLLGPDERLQNEITGRDAGYIRLGVKAQFHKDLPLDGLNAHRISRQTLGFGYGRGRWLTRRA